MTPAEPDSGDDLGEPVIVEGVLVGYQDPLFNLNPEKEPPHQ